MSMWDLFSGENAVAVIGLVSSIASILSLAQGTRSLVASEKRRAIISTCLFVTLAGISTASYLYWQGHRSDVADPHLKAKAVGLLKAADNETTRSMQTLQAWLPNEADGVTSPVAPILPDTFRTMKADVEVSALYSTEFQEEIPHFVSQNEIYQRAYEQLYSATKSSQPDTLQRMWLSSYIENGFVKLELLSKSGQLTDNKLEPRQSALRTYDFTLKTIPGQKLSFPLAQKYEEESDQTRAKAAFCLGLTLNETIALINKADRGVDEQKHIAATATVARNLGIAFEFTKLAHGATEGSKRHQQVVSLLWNGIYALHGEGMVANFEMGRVALPILHDFRMYMTDDDFAHKNQHRIVNEEFIKLNAIIGSVILPQDLTKYWIPMFMKLTTREFGAEQYIDEWAKALLQYCAGQ